MQLTLDTVPDAPPAVRPRLYSPKEYKVVALRECLPTALACDTPERAAGYWNENVKDHPYFNPETECFVVLLLDTRRKVKGHVLVSTGTLDTILVHAREVFRPAIVAAAGAIVIMHNHPSGDPTPSEADIRVTRDLVNAGKMLKIEVLDHVVMGRADSSNGRTHGYTSLRELGYFY